MSRKKHRRAKICPTSIVHLSVGMEYDEKALIEELERLGITMWVDGRPIGHRKNGGLVGGPKCANCENEFEWGITFKGNGSLCKDCLDRLRQQLFRSISRSLEGVEDPDEPEGEN